MMTLVEERECLFDENFKCKTDNYEDIIHFCKRLKEISGIQTCNHLGMMYEYLPEVYAGIIAKQKNI